MHVQLASKITAYSDQQTCSLNGTEPLYKIPWTAKVPFPENLLSFHPRRNTLKAAIYTMPSDLYSKITPISTFHMM